MSKSASIAQTRSRVPPRVAKVGDSALVRINGLIDERFPGFGDLSGVRTAVIDLGGVSFMTSFGVRQWLLSMAAVPPEVANLYLLNCPSIIVDQLNMIFNFGGRSKVVSLTAPFMCTSCSAESKQTIDVLSEGAALTQGKLAPRNCTRCGSALELDEIVESYFACLTKYGATSVDPAAAALIAQSAGLETKEVKSVLPVRAPSAAPAGVILPTVHAPVAAPRSSGKSVAVVAVVAVVVVAMAAGIYVLVGPS